jgi:hypothetical protein
MDEEEALSNAKAIVRDVVNRGIFMARKPEGKVRDH